jgi:hypothetical protein
LADSVLENCPSTISPSVAKIRRVNGWPDSTAKQSFVNVSNVGGSYQRRFVASRHSGS